MPSPLSTFLKDDTWFFVAASFILAGSLEDFAVYAGTLTGEEVANLFTIEETLPDYFFQIRDAETNQ